MSTNTTPPMHHDSAIGTVVRRVIYDLIEGYLNTGEGWEDYPEIGKHDWDRVGAGLAYVAETFNDGPVYAEAYALLAARAGSDETES